MVGSSTRYKVLFLSRHGQGYHNAAEAHFGTNAWECYWAMQGTNGTHEWGPDAKLTPHGIDEAAQTAAAWRKQISLGAPIPERHFVSPLSRSIKTMEVTWKDVYGWLGGSTLNSAPRELKPVVKEILRETLSLHYYDHRSHLTTLHQNFPYLLFSPLPTQYSGAAAFPEEDPFWDFHRESYFMRDLRVKTALQELIAEAGDNVTYIGVTCHYGVIQSALKVLGHHPVEVGTAGVVPVVVRVEDGVVNGTSGGWYEKHAKRVEEEIVRRSVCDGFSEVWVQGGYVVPGGMGPDE
ncbi:histidine phosphatase superfamily [Kalaharituber pfeilii]|nr:histidine phosphatase superfamily [Kalaharituber pfeilii]